MSNSPANFKIHKNSKLSQSTSHEIPTPLGNNTNTPRTSPLRPDFPIPISVLYSPWPLVPPTTLRILTWWFWNFSYWVSTRQLPMKKCLLGNSPVNTLAVHFSHFAKISSQVLTQFACLPTKGLSTGHSSTGHSQSTCPWNHFSPDELWFCPISIMPMLNTVPRE